ncbi:MAG TPA: phospholipase D-like domain-containing protein [Beijerinckiaceae bacterium]|nr:phospholipase D-like domain-containing protein [Beijerinckiaceae bacterium]
MAYDGFAMGQGLLEPAAEPATRILRPGHNCWRIERARRASVLVDACEYFARLEQSLRRARRSITILGWDFDARTKLCPDQEDCKPLGPFLRDLVETHPELEVRILIWSFSVVHAPSESLPMILGAEWQNHPRITVKLDNQHPVLGSHHQKIVCIDDAVAFAGGMDLTIERWDTADHRAGDPRRVNPDGKPYGPVHDIHMAVDGPVAQALAELTRERWWKATGETLAPCAPAGDPWPAGLAPDFTNVRIAVSRTAPAMGDTPAVKEAAALAVDALAAARRHVFIEAQYFTAPLIGDLLMARLPEPDCPEIVVVVTECCHGAVERLVLGANRDRLIRKLKQVDAFDRLRVYRPVSPTEDGDLDILIHSKLIVVDEDFLRIGSSNLNNRSVALDTECDLAIEAASDRERRVIARIRNRLLAEHLGTTPNQVARALAAEGSLIRAVERLNVGRRGLRPLAAMSDEGPTEPVTGTALVDPAEPFQLRLPLLG